MSISNSRQLYLLFFVSGFCSLVYQIIWTRLAFASFGIITPVLSVVLSVFMLGLSVGAWAGGPMVSWLARKTGLSAIFFYGGAELIIGLGAFAAPGLFALGQRCLLAAGQMDSFRYLLLSALVLAASILPWCLCMGATFPCMMAYVREQDANNADSFSYLYFANVLGAMTGTILTALVLVETMGFRHSLALAAAGNFAIAALSAAIGCKGLGRAPAPAPGAPAAAPLPEVPPSDTARGGLIRWILFTTGFSSMAMEVVWTRAFTPILKTQVYSFAMIVFTYLGATFLGSLLYRRHLRRQGPAEITIPLLSGWSLLYQRHWRQDARQPLAQLLALLGLTAFFPILALDPRILPAKLDVIGGNYFDSSAAVILVLASICPLCLLLGYLTPSLIDRLAAGHPAAAGKAYGINVLGCILGPLCASYLLLPLMSERYAMVVLGLPLLGLAFLCRQSLPSRQGMAVAGWAGAAVVWSLFSAQDFEGLLKESEVHTVVRRDYAASVISFGGGFHRGLLVNGVGMTSLVPETKFMAHLPLAFHTGPPQSALIICFGMGTTYRSALSWDVPTTVVELVPSVVDAFGFYHADAASVLANPNGRIVIDDGRRYLKRTRDKYDVIVIDPPPPPEAAGSSLLYSREFYELAKEHLNPNGILQIWFPGGTLLTLPAVFRSVVDSFPYTRAFVGVNGGGSHILGSMQPIEPATAGELAARLPAKAGRDLMEWMYESWFQKWIGQRRCLTLADYFQMAVSSELPIASLLNPDPAIAITDDRPFNEYYLLRRHSLYSP